MASCGARLVWVLNTQLGRHTKSYLQPNRDLYSDKGFDISTRSLGDTMCPIFCLTSDCTNGYMHHRYMQWIGWWSYFGPCCTSCWCLKSRDSFVPTSLETQCDARSWRKEIFICGVELISPPIERLGHMQINLSFWQLLITERHCRRHCQQQRSREECSRRGCPRQSPMDFPVSSVQFINFMFGWMSCKEIRYRLWKLVNDVPDGVDRGVCMGRCSVPRSVQIGSFRWILSISILTVLTVYQQHINSILTVLTVYQQHINSILTVL